jgi:transcription elongation factor Elf1
MGRMECKICGSRKIKSRTNYPSGRKSKSRTTKICKRCGNTKAFEMR